MVNSNEILIRDEPGEYRIVMRYREDGTFSAHGESVHPITLTVRVEDMWERIPRDIRRYSYAVDVRKDCAASPVTIGDVAPDARIFIDFEKTFGMEFK